MSGHLCSGPRGGSRGNWLATVCRFRLVQSNKRRRSGGELRTLRATCSVFCNPKITLKTRPIEYRRVRCLERNPLRALAKPEAGTGPGLARTAARSAEQATRVPRPPRPTVARLAVMTAPAWPGPTVSPRMSALWGAPRVCQAQPPRQPCPRPTSPTVLPPAETHSVHTCPRAPSLARRPVPQGDAVNKVDRSSGRRRSLA